MPIQGTVSSAELLSEEEADAILQEHNLSPRGDLLPPTSTQVQEVDFGDAYRKNQEIMEACDELILERISNGDPSVKISEINGVRSEAFKQNQLIKGGSTDNINFNLNTISKMNTDELFELLGKLND